MAKDSTKNSRLISGQVLIKCLCYTSNIFLLILGLLMIIVGVTLWIQTKTFDGFIVLFILLGLSQIVLAALGYFSNKHVEIDKEDALNKLEVYLWGLFFIFICQTLVGVLGIMLEQKTIKDAVAKIGPNSYNRISEDVEFAFHFIIIALIIQFICLILGLLWRYFVNQELKKGRPQQYHIDLTNALLFKETPAPLSNSKQQNYKDILNNVHNLYNDNSFNQYELSKTDKNNIENKQNHEINLKQ